MRRVQLWAIAPIRFLAQKVLRLATLLLLSLTFFGWTLPAQAASQISPRLEEQILQVIRQHPEVILESVQAYQQQQQQQLNQAQQSFLQEFKTNPKAVIGESPTTGTESSKVVLIEFSDFQCPYCAQAHDTLKQLIAKHPDEVTLSYKHFPLTPIHPEAMPAAKAAWAADRQGKFWEYHDALFAKQEKLGEELYVEIAQTLNLDLEQFNRDRASVTASAAIGEDIKLAESLGLAGTPFFLIDTETFSGPIQLSDMENLLTAAK
ncbi:DsbA family protein [Coleofasciculus sp. H7-2]|uniref:DsbA family protein n=1 Tax=Coleofasciculus sp. H7-2 TaxID=3351545 RepID=UPI003671775D